MADKWDVDEEGNIKLAPLAGWDVNVGAGTFCLLRIRSLADRSGKEAPPLQLAMTAEQCIQLAADLSAAARRIAGGD